MWVLVGIVILAVALQIGIEEFFSLRSPISDTYLSQGEKQADLQAEERAVRHLHILRKATWPY